MATENNPSRESEEGNEAPHAERKEEEDPIEPGPPVANDGAVIISDPELHQLHPPPTSYHHPYMPPNHWSHPPYIYHPPPYYDPAQQRIDQAVAYAHAAANVAWAAAQAVQQVVAESSSMPHQPQFPSYIPPPPPQHPSYAPPMMPPAVHHHPYYWARSIPPPPPSEVYYSPLDPPIHEQPSFSPSDHPPLSTRRIDKRRGRQSDNESSSSGGARHRTFSKKKKASSSLLGKTGVAALFEWCSQRQWTPVFEVVPAEAEEFTCTVYLQESAHAPRKEWGRGRGRNKHAAKQESARRALQALIPGGVVFDEDTGMLVALPSSLKDPLPADDLAPHLAKQLAIGRNPEDGDDVTGAPPKRTYPTGETSSEDDSSSAYYASRGASVCSVLLHTIIQIDKARIIDAPSFSYQVMPSSALMPPASNNMESQRRKSPAVARFLRGSFQCTAQLKIREANEERLLTAVGVGGTKRDARHVASAKLLSLLFPECQDDMAQVKQAAEAMRDRYAAARSKSIHTHDSNASHASSLLPLAQAGDPPIPPALLHCLSTEFRSAAWDAAFVFRQWSRQKQRDRAVESALLGCNDGDDADVGRIVLRRALPEDLSRIKKLLCRKTLDRTIPRASGAKRGGDMSQHGPHHYLSELSSTLADVSIMDHSNHNVSPDGSDMISQLWSSPSMIVLLLCRAITEDPPLGCAVMTLGFSMEEPEGKVLRLVEMASEPHLPQERFMDCLQNFAKCMNCNLVGHGGLKSKQLRKEDTSHRLYTRDMWTVIDSYTKKHSRSDEANPTPHVPNSTKPPPSDVRKTGNCYQASNSAGLTHLQSVQEESERSEEEEEDSRSGTDSPPVNTAALKSSSAVASNGGRTVKPSKRSRFK